MPRIRRSSFSTTARCPWATSSGEEGMGFKYTMQQLGRERLEVCIKSQTYAEECFKEALDYAKVREAFGKPIGNFEHISFELAEMATEIEIGITFLHVCVEEFVRGEDITKKVSMAKAWICGNGKQGRLQGRPDPRRLRIHGGIPDMPALSGRARDAHLRGDDGDHERRHRAAARSEAAVLRTCLIRKKSACMIPGYSARRGLVMIRPVCGPGSWRLTLCSALRLIPSNNFTTALPAKEMAPAAIPLYRNSRFEEI